MALGLQVIAPVHLQVAGATLNLPFSGTVTVSTPATGAGFGTFNIDSRDLASAIQAGCWLHTNVDLQTAFASATSLPSVIPDGPIPLVVGTPTVCGWIKSANFNSTADQQFTWVNGGLFVPTQVVVTNASLSLTTAAGGIYSAASKAGNVIVAAATTYTALTTATAAVVIAPAATNTLTYTATTMPYLSLTTAQGAAATADVYLIGYSIA